MCLHLVRARRWACTADCRRRLLLRLTRRRMHRRAGPCVRAGAEGRPHTTLHYTTLHYTTPHYAGLSAVDVRNASSPPPAGGRGRSILGPCDDALIEFSYKGKSRKQSQTKRQRAE
jgi:hypothetical protein